MFNLYNEDYAVLLCICFISLYLCYSAFICTSAYNLIICFLLYY